MITTEGEEIINQEGKNQDCCETFYNAQGGAPKTKSYLSQNVNNVKTEVPKVWKLPRTD